MECSLGDFTVTAWSRRGDIHTHDVGQAQTAEAIGVIETLRGRPYQLRLLGAAVQSGVEEKDVLGAEDKSK